MITTSMGTCRADELIAALPAQAWCRLSAGAGAHGPRDYDWARLSVRICWWPGRGHWLLAAQHRHRGDRPTTSATDPAAPCGARELGYID